MFEGDIRLRCSKPTIFVLGMVDGFVPFVQVLIAKQGIVNNIPLTTCIVEGVAVALSREVKPLKGIQHHVLNER